MEDIVQYTKAAAYIAAAFTMAVGTIGPALAQGIIGAKACENIVKSGEQSGDLKMMFFAGLGFVESGMIYCLLVAGVLLYFAGAS